MYLTMNGEKSLLQHPHSKPRRLRVFYPEDGGNMFLKNVGSYKNHTVSSYPRRQHSSLFQQGVSPTAHIPFQLQLVRKLKSLTLCLQNISDDTSLLEHVANQHFIMIKVELSLNIGFLTHKTD
jgi:hypothetical protein